MDSGQAMEIGWQPKEAEARESFVFSFSLCLYAALTYTKVLLWSVVNDLNMSCNCQKFLFGEVTFIWEMPLHKRISA